MKYKIKITVRSEEIAKDTTSPEWCGFLSHHAYANDTTNKYFYVRDDNESTPAHVFNKHDDLATTIENIDEICPMNDVKHIEIIPVA